jgi:hypothetical protein
MQHAPLKQRATHTQVSSIEVHDNGNGAELACCTHMLPSTTLHCGYNRAQALVTAALWHLNCAYAAKLNAHDVNWLDTCMS